VIAAVKNENLKVGQPSEKQPTPIALASLK
jgi:hypothetical protein